MAAVPLIAPSIVFGNEWSVEFLFIGIVRIGRGVGRPLLFGDALFLADRFLFVPGTALRGRLREGKAHRQGDCGRHQHHKDQALSPHLATAFFIAPFVEMGQGGGACGALLVALVDDQTARGDAP
jgi:hypothetical protein